MRRDVAISEPEPPVETGLVRCLRCWSDDPNAPAAGGRTCEQEIAWLLEAFICECVGYDPAGMLANWWSDGVIQLRIDQQSSDCYKLVGVTWIGVTSGKNRLAGRMAITGLAPFDIDVKLSLESDRYFAKCVFRLGLLDSHGWPMVCEPGRPVGIETRENGQWAMAVELTPPDTDQREPLTRPR